MFLVIIDVILQNQKQELQHTLWPLNSSSLVLILTESAKFDICDIPGVGLIQVKYYFILQLHYKKPITHILPSPSLA